MHRAVRKILEFSARAYDRILKVAERSPTLLVQKQLIPSTSERRFNISG
jgi:hypothetical protein